MDQVLFIENVTSFIINEKTRFSKTMFRQFLSLFVSFNLILCQRTNWICSGQNACQHETGTCDSGCTINCSGDYACLNSTIIITGYHGNNFYFGVESCRMQDLYLILQMQQVLVVIHFYPVAKMPKLSLTILL